MELMEAIRSRRSVRSYAATPVERVTLEKLIDAAVLAPSASNSQPWAFGVIEGVERIGEYGDRAKVAFLARIAADPAQAAFRARLSDPAYRLFHGAPALVCIYARLARDNATGDCSMAAQNLMLAARELGLGTCWIGLAHPLFNSPELKGELGVPAEYSAVAQIIVGYPEGGFPEARERMAPEIIFWR